LDDLIAANGKITGIRTTIVVDVVAVVAHLARFNLSIATRRVRPLLTRTPCEPDEYSRQDDEKNAAHCN